MSCEMCTDPDGAPCFPLHGLAPHIHKPDSIEFHTEPMEGFTPDQGDPRQGVHWCPHCGDGKPAEPPTPKFSPYGGFSEGDHVTRDGTDVHLVKDMTADGFAATFVCVVAPATEWTAVGEEEFNVCRRYARLKRDEVTQEWKQDPDAQPTIKPYWDAAARFRSAFQSFLNDIAQRVCEAIGKKLKMQLVRRSRSDHYKRKTHRRAKRRALRK